MTNTIGSCDIHSAYGALGLCFLIMGVALVFLVMAWYIDYQNLKKLRQWAKDTRLDLPG